ncbi:carboxypeptidase regulatory-like domain-containing protein [Hymenobacter jeollabukensis]|nr:carboxypeptidase regulatory-like domain-containing protein [Hymenobacter jeollabukensis]
MPQFPFALVALASLLTWSPSASAQAQQADSLATPAPATDAADTPPAWLTLTGVVVDEFSLPLAGATVTLAGSPKYLCITNAEGGYLLEVPAGGGDIRVAFSGYYEQVFSAQRSGERDVLLLPLPGFKRDRKGRVIDRRPRQLTTSH